MDDKQTKDQTKNVSLSGGMNREKGTSEEKPEGKHITWGPPGCGKTTWAAKKVYSFLQYFDPREDGTSPVMLCSLTRAAAAELASRDMRVPKSQMGTLHSLAYRKIGHQPIAETKIDEFNEWQNKYEITVDMPKTVDEFEGAEGIADQETESNRLYSQYSLVRARMVPPDEWPEQLTRFGKVWEAWKGEFGYIDFTDMIEVALTSTTTAPGVPDVIIADEAQDLSALEFALIEHWAQKAQALYLVGDPWQSLYTWRGASPACLSENLPKGNRRLLQQSYRVPELVRQKAMGWVRQLSDYMPIKYKARLVDLKDPSKGVVEGEVGMTDATFSRPETILRKALLDIDAGKSVMIIGSCSYMLIPTLTILKKNGIPFANPWRRHRRDWNPLGRTRGTSFSERITAFMRPRAGSPGSNKLWNYHELNAFASCMQSSELMNVGAKNRMKEWAKERGGRECTVDDLLKVFTEATLGQLMRMMETDVSYRESLNWYDDRIMASKAKGSDYPLRVAKGSGVHALHESPKLCIGTIHSVKGGEADCVYLFPDLSPAASRSWDRGGEDKDSVVRTFYVGMTRAREKLVTCAPKSYYGRSVRL